MEERGSYRTYATTEGGAGDDFESLLERALRIDVPDKAVPGSRRKLRLWLPVAIAASVVLAVGVMIHGLYDARYFGGDDLGADVVAHMHHEPESLRRTEASVDPGEFDRVLRQAGARLSVAPPSVSYVKLCPFRGRMVAHFVVQASHGPVTVLLLPDEQIPSRVALDEDGFVGTLLPLDEGGSIAVVGEADEDIKQVKDQVASALRWRL
ncbi:MAG: DUF3379 family protein [Gammaproteobacteria bacterium]|jgi:hypothetical protein